MCINVIGVIINYCLSVMIGIPNNKLSLTVQSP